MYNILEFNFHPGTTKFDAHGRPPTSSSLSKNDRSLKKETNQLSSHFHFYNNQSYGVSGLPIIVMDPKLVLERHHVVSSPGEEPHSFNQGDEEIWPCLHILN